MKKLLWIHERAKMMHEEAASLLASPPEDNGASAGHPSCDLVDVEPFMKQLCRFRRAEFGTKPSAGVEATYDFACSPAAGAGGRAGEGEAARPPLDADEIGVVKLAVFHVDSSFLLDQKYSLAAACGLIS